MHLIFLLLALAAPPAAAVRVHAAEIEARLAAIVGDWTIHGQESTYRETCEWYRNRSFVVCTTEDRSDGSASQSILGYSKQLGRFTYHNFSASGSSRSELGFPHGERGIVYVDERQTAKGLTRVTTWVEPEPEGRVHFRQAQSVDGGTWKTTADFHYIRRRP